MTEAAPKRDAVLLLARVAALLSLALMVGGIFSVGSLVAPVVFADLPPVQAGALMGHVFQRFDAVLVTSAVLLLAAELVIFWRQGRHEAADHTGRRRLQQLKGFLIAALLVSLSYGIFVIHPQMRDLKADAPDSAAGVAALGDDEQARFDALHHRAEQLYKLDWMLAVGLVVLAAL